ncbi:MAG TPA: PIG-L family deacetylase [Devosia sp.]|nr:PIG-L family deacetylase [Devosia sp.]
MRITGQDRLNRQRARPRIARLWLALQPLRSCVSFMNTGAHPDDETSPMLAVLALRDGVKLSHACATRGEGGQNALGLETGKSLGVVRTREMERAAEVLNMSQYWLSEEPGGSIFDFGFSKSGEETLQHWGKERVLKRFVQILRRERPDIVCPTFLDVPGQHGHHRAMTRSAFRAVELAADPAAFPELGLGIWQVKKVYLPAWSGAGDAYDDDVPPPPETTRVDGGGGDDVLGADYGQIGQWSRAFHRTQGMGAWVERGQKSDWPLNLAWSGIGVLGPETKIFEGLPKTLADLADFAGTPELSEPLAKAQNELDAAISAFPDDKKIREHGAAALGFVRQALKICPDHAKSEILHRLAAKEHQVSKVLALAGRIDCRIAVAEPEVRPGEKIELELHLYAPEMEVGAEIIAPEGWSVGRWEAGRCRIGVPEEARPGNAYPDFWSPEQANGEVFVRLSWEEQGQAVSLDIDLEERIFVLPSHSATLEPVATLLNLTKPGPVEILVSSRFPKKAKPELVAPAGWSVGEEERFALDPEPGLKAGIYEFALRLEGQPVQSVSRMGYEHTGALRRVGPGVARIRVLDVKLPSAKIAYIGGGSDRSDHWLRALEMDITNLGEDALEKTDFTEFDSILVGVFAFRTRSALNRRLPALHDWVQNGGNLVTLYHRPWDNWDPEHTPTARIEIGRPSLRWRVTDENAKVTHLVPGHKLLTTPNMIGEDDWAGWHKERGLYFACGWDKAYVPLLSMADRQEKPLHGALLSAKIGAGRHTHTSLILHHQMEKLVPGAFCIMANLLAPAKA